MPTYRVKFRSDKDDQLIEADSMGEQQGSYVFLDEKINEFVAQIPKDVVLVIVEEDHEA